MYSVKLIAYLILSICFIVFRLPLAIFHAANGLIMNVFYIVTRNDNSVLITFLKFFLDQKLKFLINEFERKRKQFSQSTNFIKINTIISPLSDFKQFNTKYQSPHNVFTTQNPVKSFLFFVCEYKLVCCCYWLYDDDFLTMMDIICYPVAASSHKIIYIQKAKIGIILSCMGCCV